MMITALTLTLSGFGGFGDAAETSGKINRVYIVPLSHLDIGFTASPREVSPNTTEATSNRPPCRKQPARCPVEHRVHLAA